MIYKISYMVAHKLITKSCDMKKLLLLFFLSVCSVPIFRTNYAGTVDEYELGTSRFL